MSDEDLLNPPRFEAQLLKKQVVSILTAWGMALKEADIASTVMIETDLRGVDSHGINMLRQYEETFKRGALNIKAQTKIIRDRSTTALLDADRGLGHPVSVQAMEMAINKAFSIRVKPVVIHCHTSAVQMSAWRKYERSETLA